MKSGLNSMFLRLSLIALLVGVVQLAGIGPAFAGQTYTIKMATVGNPGDSLVKFFEYFGAEIEKRSNGVIKTELFQSSQLGAHRDYIDGLQIGSIQMAEMASSVVATVDTAFSIFDMPYISPNEQDQWETLKAGADKILTDSLLKKAGIRVVGWVVRTPRNVYSSKGSILSAADFKDLKIRTMESQPMLRAMQLLGAKATPIPANERYLALQTRVVDAAENNSGEIYFKKEYEVTKYLSKTSHIIQPNVYCIGEAFFATLPADMQKLVLEVGREASEVATKFDFDSVDEIEAFLAKDGGMIITDIPDKSDFVRILQPLYQEYAGAIGQDLMNMFLKK